MARPLRIEYPGAVYHLTSRGDGREDIFASDADRTLFLVLLGQTINRFHWLCHAYCLMDNHYHLLVETPLPNLSRAMRHLNGVYTQRYNRRNGRVGHVFHRSTLETSGSWRNTGGTRRFGRFRGCRGIR